MISTKNNPKKVESTKIYQYFISTMTMASKKTFLLPFQVSTKTRKYCKESQQIRKIYKTFSVISTEKSKNSPASMTFPSILTVNLKLKGSKNLPGSMNKTRWTLPSTLSYRDKKEYLKYCLDQLYCEFLR